MSHSSSIRRHGGELVDCGDWHNTSITQSNTPNTQTDATPIHTQIHHAAGASSRNASISNSKSVTNTSAPSNRSAPMAHPAASSKSARIFDTSNSSIDMWLNSEPVTLAAENTSDRPLYCLSVNERNNSFVVGGADHSLRVYDMSSVTMRRELYSKVSRNRHKIPVYIFSACTPVMDEPRM
jgi:hypothetical protein